MASAPGKYEWLVVIPDHGGVLDKRMEVRPYVLVKNLLLKLKLMRMIGSILRVSREGLIRDFGGWEVCSSALLQFHFQFGMLL